VSCIRIFAIEDCLKSNTPKELHEIKAPTDVVFTKAVWGPKNETIIIAANNGKLFQYDLVGNQIIHEASVHRGEILSLDMTYDYTMLLTGSKDGYAKLINPDDLKVVKEYAYGKPVRSASISPLFDSEKHQKFHCILSGG